MIAITGATGLVGSHLIYFLAQKGYQIKALYHEESKIDKIKAYFEHLPDFKVEIWPQIHWSKVDIRDYADLEETFTACEAVFHTAAFVSFRKADRQLMKEINIEATANVVNACLNKKVGYLVYISSVAALDKVQKGSRITEEFAFDKKTNKLYYGKTKFEAEMEIFRGIAEGLKAVVVNPSIILGYSPFRQSSANLFYQIKEGLALYSPGSTGFVDVWDVVEILWQLFEHKISNERFIVCAGHWTYKALLENIATQLGAKIPKFQIPFTLAIAFAFLSEKIHPKSTNINVETVRSAYENVYYDNSKIIEALNYKFKNLEDMIKQTAKMYDKL